MRRRRECSLPVRTICFLTGLKIGGVEDGEGI